jgi:flagellar basal-body rod modification protein FlgD
MNDTGIRAASSLLPTLRPAAQQEEALGKTAFLELMIAQMENQDPLAPESNSEFVAQLAQFSTVEGLENLNDSVGGMAGAFRQSLALQASTLVGRSVRVVADGARYDGVAPVAGSAVLAASTPELRVTVADAAGNVVRTLQLGARPAGEARFAWDGTSDAGLPLPAGRYLLQAEARGADGLEPVPVEVGANVDSVTLTAGGQIVLNVDGVGPVPMAEVREIR